MCYKGLFNITHFGLLPTNKNNAIAHFQKLALSNAELKDITVDQLIGPYWNKFLNGSTAVTPKIVGVLALKHFDLISKCKQKDLNKMLLKDKPFHNFDLRIGLISAILEHNLNEMHKLQMDNLKFLKLNNNYHVKLEDLCNKFDNSLFLLRQSLLNLNHHTEISQFKLIVHCIKYGHNNKTVKGLYFRSKDSILKRPGEVTPSLNNTINNKFKNNRNLINSNSSNNFQFNKLFNKLDMLDNKLIKNSNNINNNNYKSSNYSNNYKNKNFNKKSETSSNTSSNSSNYMPDESQIMSFMQFRKCNRNDAINKLREYKDKECWQYSTTNICKNGSKCWYRH